MMDAKRKLEHVRVPNHAPVNHIAHAEPQATLRCHASSLNVPCNILKTNRLNFFSDTAQRFTVQALMKRKLPCNFNCWNCHATHLNGLSILLRHLPPFYVWGSKLSLVAFTLHLRHITVSNSSTISQLSFNAFPHDKAFACSLSLGASKESL